MSAETDNDTAITVIAGAFVLPWVVAVMVPALLWAGWAVTILWGWFVVPTFGLAQISISQAAGLSLLVAAMRVKLAAPKDNTTLGMKLFAIIAGPPVTVGVGWVIKWVAL